MHHIFHVSMLTLYQPDPSYILSREKVEINEGVSMKKNLCKS